VIDTITLACTYGPKLAKVVHPDGSIEDYAQAKRFDLYERQITGLDDLEGLLRQAASRPDLAVVRGGIADPARVRRVRRLLHPDAVTGEQPTLVDCPRSWIPLDVDGLPCPPEVDVTDVAECAGVACVALPPAFRGVELLAQATASHGIRPGLHLRLWFRGSRPTVGAELKRWLRTAPVDRGVFTASQLIYSASPIFLPGIIDPLPVRLVRIRHVHTTVRVPEPATLPPPPRRPPPSPVQAASQALTTLAVLTVKATTAPRGARHDTLCLVARRFVELEGQGLIAPGELEKLLTHAARGAGLEADGRNVEREVAGILQWARRI
jgi:hypothetical protein